MMTLIAQVKGDERERLLVLKITENNRSYIYDGNVLFKQPVK